MESKCCGNCVYHRFEGIDEDWICTNAASEYCGDWTPYAYLCEDWEERD